MEKGGRQQKFHEALINIYYPSQPLQPDHHVEDGDEPVVIGHEGLNMDQNSDADDLEKAKSSSDTSDSAPQKLTRAQRKRLRTKKLKEAALCRRKIIGPLLPSAHEDPKDDPLDLREEPTSRTTDNAVQSSDEGISRTDKPLACTLPNKLKHRRIAKRRRRSVLDCSNLSSH